MPKELLLDIYKRVIKGLGNKNIKGIPSSILEIRGDRTLELGKVLSIIRGVD